MRSCNYHISILMIILLSILVSSNAYKFMFLFSYMMFIRFVDMVVHSASGSCNLHQIDKCSFVIFQISDRRCLYTVKGRCWILYKF